MSINWLEGKAVSATFDFLAKDVKGVILTLDHSDQPIWGKWSEVGDSLHFKPIVPFTPGLTYQLRKDREVILSFSISQPAGKRTKVIAIFPAVDTVPANLLKVHIHFSAPMGEQYSESFIRVFNREGDTLEKIFLPLRPELWDASHQILTLWLDPGRIKRDLGPNRLWGQPMNEGEQYTIDISAGWKDRQSMPLEAPFKKVFEVDEPDRIRPQIKDWEMIPPKRGSLDSLQVCFREVLDQTLASECLTILRDGKLIEGNSRLEAKQQIWMFTPKAPWQKGIYQILIESRLEDLAGNNLNRLFDKDLNHSLEEIEQEDHFLTFELN